MPTFSAPCIAAQIVTKCIKIVECHGGQGDERARRICKRHMHVRTTPAR
jgi:hypothetical protein